jgi:hypothetical protein
MNKDEDVLPCHDKMVFDTKKEAETTAIVAEHTRGTKLKAYLCAYCQLWHLSSV